MAVFVFFCYGSLNCEISPLQIVDLENSVVDQVNVSLTFIVVMAVHFAKIEVMKIIVVRHHNITLCFN